MQRPLDVHVEQASEGPFQIAGKIQGREGVRPLPDSIPPENWIVENGLARGPPVVRVGAAFRPAQGGFPD